MTGELLVSWFKMLQQLFNPLVPKDQPNQAKPGLENIVTRKSCIQQFFTASMLSHRERGVGRHEPHREFLILETLLHREKGEKTRTAELPVVGAALSDFQTSGKVSCVSVETRFPRGFRCGYPGWTDWSTCGGSMKMSISSQSVYELELVNMAPFW